MAGKYENMTRMLQRNLEEKQRGIQQRALIREQGEQIRAVTHIAFVGGTLALAAALAFGGCETSGDDNNSRQNPRQENNNRPSTFGFFN